MLNDFQKAKEFYEKAAELNSLLYNPNFSLGQIALLYGDLEEAEKYFMKNVQSEEKEAGPYNYLAQIAMLKGEEEKAVNYINTNFNGQGVKKVERKRNGYEVKVMTNPKTEVKFDKNGNFSSQKIDD